ncbi:hypothetical protein DENSPDRAFT_447141 [Dentipellis sp. KUC8613]|nr:hypothetical protein DENSPDRAFT_447141 [Dentipellis sp. KUC8613]
MIEVYKPRLFTALVDSTSSITHLRLDGGQINDMIGLQGVRGLKIIMLGLLRTREDASAERWVESGLDAMRNIIVDNAETLTDISQQDTCPPGSPLPFVLDGLECEFLRITRLSIHYWHSLSFDVRFEKIASIFPNLRRLELDCFMETSAGPVRSPVWPALTTLIVPQDVLLKLAEHSDNCPSLRQLVIRNHLPTPTPRFQAILQTIRRLHIYELSLGIPIAEIGRPPRFDDVAAPSNFISKISESAPQVRKLDLHVVQEPDHPVPNLHLIPVFASYACAFKNLTYLSFSFPSTRAQLSCDILQALAVAWFSICPALVCIGISIRPGEFRLMRHQTTDENDNSLGTIIRPQYRNNAYSEPLAFATEVSAFSLDDSNRGPRMTSWSDTVL